MTKSSATRSDLDNKTIALIEQVAAEVRASIEGGEAAGHQASGAQPGQCHL